MKQFMEGIAPLVDTNDLCGECPVWDSISKRLYWTDCVGQKFHCYDWTSSAYQLVKSGVEIYGFRPNRGGGFAVTNTSGVWLWKGDGEMALVAAEAEGTRLQLNDCCADSAGRLVTGSFFYNPAGDYELGKLIRIDINGHACVLDDGYHLANGLGFSPDERTLYAADTVAGRIYRYDYDPSTGSAARRRVFVTVPAEEGLPDGLAVDAEGFVWSAQWYGAAVVRYDPDGVVERRLAVPAKQPSSVAFGGPQLTELFITSAAQSERMPVMPPGYDPDTGPFGGPLYHARLGIAGQVQHPADLRISR